jgi:hypothetical protein
VEGRVVGKMIFLVRRDMEKLFIKWINEEYNSVAETLQLEHAKAVWKFETNVTNFNEAAMVCIFLLFFFSFLFIIL